jgi:hypothetical protein
VATPAATTSTTSTATTESTATTTTQTTEATSTTSTVVSTIITRPTFQPTYLDKDCIDTPGYTDLYGDTCDYYSAEENYPQACQYFGNITNNDSNSNNSSNNVEEGTSPNDNCCVCKSILPPFPTKWYPTTKKQSSSSTNDDTTNPPPAPVPWESEYISCIYGNDYPQEYHIHIPLRELMLFDSKDECCTEYARIEACRPTQGPTSLLTQPLSNSGAAFSYHGWYLRFPLAVGCVVSILLVVAS